MITDELKNMAGKTVNLARNYYLKTGETAVNNFAGNEFFFGRVQQVEKDWIQVSLDNSETPATGWLRWRKGDSILISMTEFTYE